VRTTDAGGLSFEKVFTVTVNNVNEAPSDIALSANTIAENNAANATVGTMSSTDADAGDTHTYTLVSGTGSTDNAAFNISGNSLRVNNTLDFEAKSSYSIRVRATDAGGLSFEKVFAISVSNVNEAPTNINSTQLAIYENNTANATVSNLSSIDPDAGDTHTYTLVSGAGSADNNSFSIVNNQLRAAVVFKFKDKSSYSIRIRTTDAGGLSFEKTFTISIIESPVASGTGNLPGTNQITASSNDVTISKGYSSQLNVAGPGLVTYSWSPSIGLSATNVANPIASPSQTTVYTVTVTNAAGLTTVLYVTVNVVEDYNVTPTNILTPNGDGINDYWVIDNLDSYPDNEVQIFDKAGRILYQVKNYQNNWDGTINSNLLAEGTYYYVINFGSGKKIKKGYITIIRD
jgi:gliding motility-associated-like protein